MRFRILGAVQNDDTAHHADLRRGKTHAGRVIHGFQHVGGKRAKFRRDVSHGLTRLFQARVGVDQDGADHVLDLRRGGEWCK